MIVNDINMKLSLFSADKGVTIDRESETGDLMVRCLYGSGTIFTKNKQQKITVGDTIFIPRKQGYTIKAEERLKFTEMFIL
jgi:quercetin dioxygenase-like cupin family protein